MSRPPLVNFIGAGVVARFHAQAAAKLPQPAKLRVTDLNPAARDAFSAEYPGAIVAASADEIFNTQATENEIAIICTPPKFHASLACEALRSGRHVLCEKPFAMNVEEAREMIAVARENNRLIACCSSRYLGRATVRALKQALADGSLGVPYYLTFINRRSHSRTGIEYQPSSRWALDTSINGGGVMMIWGPYDVAVMLALLQPQRVDILSAWMTSPNMRADLPPGTVFDVEEQVGASIRFHLGNGCNIDVTYERAACTFGDPLSIAELQCLSGAAKWEWWHGTEAGNLILRRELSDGSIETAEAHYRDGPGSSVQDWPLHALWDRLNGGKRDDVTMEDALFNFSVVRAVYDVVESGQPKTVVREVS